MVQKTYDAAAFSEYLQKLIARSGKSMRQISLAAGLSHGAVGGFIRYTRHPHRDSCLLLAEVLGVDPNEMLQMAGYEPLPIVERSLIDPAEFPSDVKAFAEKFKNIPPERRREIFDALEVLLKNDFMKT